MAASPSSSDFISIASTTATTTSSTPMNAVPTRVPDAVAGHQGQADAEQREDQAEQRREVLEQHDRQLGRLGGADEAAPTTGCPGCGCDSRIAVRKEKPSSAIAASSTAIGTHCQSVIGSGCWNLWYASYSANRPPRLNSTIETMNA